MRNLLRYLGAGKREQDESGSKEITPADRVRAAHERAKAHEQKPPAEEPVPARGRPLTTPAVPAHSVEEPPTPRPEHGEYTSAENSTIPIIRTVREAYAFLWHQRRDFISLVAPAFMVVVILSTLLTWMFPKRFAAPGEFIVIAFPIIVAWVAMVVMFAVAWHRRYLVPDDDVTVRAAYHWRPRHTGFLVAVIVVGLWAALTFVLVFFPAILVAGPFIRILWPEPPEEWAISMLGLGVIWIASVFAACVAARYSMLMPSSAVGQRMSSAECWRFTQGNGSRLALIIVLIAIAIFVITLALDALQSLLFDSEGFIADSAALFFDELVWFVGLALGISVLSIAYRRLMAVMSPARSHRQPLEGLPVRRQSGLYTMDFPIEHQDFAGRGLCVRAAGFFKGHRLLIDGAEVKGTRLKFSVRDNSGIEREIRLKSNGYNPVPTVEIDGETIVLAQPLAWYEIVLMWLPLFPLVYIGEMIFGTVGGGLGVGIGFFVIFASARVFRSDRSTAAKYGLNTLVVLGAAVPFYVGAVVRMLLLE